MVGVRDGHRGVSALGALGASAWRRYSVARALTSARFGETTRLPVGVKSPLGLVGVEVAVS